jgi:hypothetical protein
MQEVGFFTIGSPFPMAKIITKTLIDLPFLWPKLYQNCSWISFSYGQNFTKTLLDLLFLWPKLYRNTLGPPSYLTQPQGGFAKGTQVMTNLGVVA